MKINILILLIIAPILLISINVQVPGFEIKENKIVSEMPTMLTPGEPSLPYYSVKLLLPMGEEFSNVTVDVSYFDNTRNNVYIKPLKQLQPISSDVVLPEVPNSKIYDTNDFFPTKNYNILGTERINGYEILYLNLYPIQYNPITNQIKWFESAEITVNTKPNELLLNQQNNMLIDNAELKDKIANLVVNSSVISSYNKTFTNISRDLPDPSDPYSMVIITDEIRQEYLNDYVDWKNENGISTKIFLTSEIYENYTGEDDPAKIRNFILDAYQCYSATDTPLQYVILGGDDEIIPIRRVFIQAGNTVDANMPSDLYYACLDNNWDGNGNGIYGEVGDNPDLLPEISLGRFPAETAVEFANIVRKTESYVEESTIGNDIFFGMGENLNWNPVTWGGDYMDEVLGEVPEIISNYHVFTRYERDGNYNSSIVMESINNGLSAINHMGHANYNIVFGLTPGTAHALTNTEYGFAYTQGCYPAAFDESTSQQTECVAENLVFADGGLYAFVGNTRYGWYSPGNTNGPSQPYDTAFFKAIYTDDIRELGRALDQSRIDMVAGALENAYLRWVHYELILFGDPSIAVKDAVGGFPFITPLDYSINDTQGDNDGQANPGEIIEISVELHNSEGWSDAEDVIGTISFEDDAIILINDEVNFGDIAQGATSNLGTFIIELPQEVNYGSFQFALTVSAPVGTSSTFIKTFNLDFEISLFQMHWPWNSSVAIRANPIITDIDGEDSKGLLVVDSYGNINYLENDATQKPNFPVENDEYMLNSAAYADINNDNQKDLIIATRDGSIDTYDIDGNIIFEYVADVMQIITPVISDIDGDDLPEIISFGIDGKIIALDGNGNVKEGFPIETGEVSFIEIAVADLDNDGAADIIFSATSGLLHAYKYDGTEVAGFPFDCESNITSAPIVLDNKRIVFGTGDDLLYLLEPNGEVVFSRDIGDDIASSAIAADFDNDGILDIAGVTKAGELFVINQENELLPGWPVIIDGSFANAPVAADIDNDNNVDLSLFTSVNDLYCFSNVGEEIPFAPIPIGITGNSPVSIEDIDNDGDFEIISTISSGLFIIDCKLPKGDKIPWNTYRGNYARTGYYQDNTIFTDVEDNEVYFVIPSSLDGNYPNPFNPTTTISFTVEEDANETKIEVYNIKGQKIVDLVESKLSAGEHSAVWNGKDKNGKSVVTGVYFYKMNVNGKTIGTKKMLLMK